MLGSGVAGRLVARSIIELIKWLVPPFELPPEANVFEPGDRNPLVHFAGHTGAVAICADTGRPAHARAAADRGARTYFASVFVIPADFESDMGRLRRYAAQHRMVVVFANFGGPSGGLQSAGRSAVIGESGESLVAMRASGAGIAFAAGSETDWRVEVVSLTPG
jgi:NAD+ synthase (glutamine-hydrolysing)